MVRELARVSFLLHEVRVRTTEKYMKIHAIITNHTQISRDQFRFFRKKFSVPYNPNQNNSFTKNIFCSMKRLLVHGRCISVQHWSAVVPQNLLPIWWMCGMHSSSPTPAQLSTISTHAELSWYEFCRERNFFELLKSRNKTKIDIVFESRK